MSIFGNKDEKANQSEERFNFSLDQQNEINQSTLAKDIQIHGSVEAKDYINFDGSITGTIKANFPSRISYKVASKFDSRMILNEMGAEQLLGSGDMLFLENGGNILRLHGGFVSETEVESVVNYIKKQFNKR